MTVGRVGKGVATGEMRNHDFHHRVLAANAMDLFHRAYYIIQMFDYVIGMDFAEMVVRERPGAHV